MPIRQVPRLIAQLYQTTDELNSLFPRPFTPDGHLVGSIGEVVAAYLYGVDLARCSTPGFDGRMKDGRTVEIKLTARNRVSISRSDKYADLLIVLQLNSKVGFKEIYAGKFPVKFVDSKKETSRGYHLCSTKELETELKKLDVLNRVKQVESMGILNSKFRKERQ
jgi:hypothetical protein